MSTYFSGVPWDSGSSLSVHAVDFRLKPSRPMSAARTSGPGRFSQNHRVTIQLSFIQDFFFKKG